MMPKLHFKGREEVYEVMVKKECISGMGTSKAKGQGLSGVLLVLNIKKSDLTERSKIQ